MAHGDRTRFARARIGPAEGLEGVASPRWVRGVKRTFGFSSAGYDLRVSSVSF